ncbi:ead/Ea22-like family protein [Escherichia coli]|nr:ead/Ea22-like family protein [Escherichia coli]EFO0455987.1 ead/Ea22-like family protein [Escherichia coli]
MSELYYPLRERYSPKPAPKCSVCGEEMSMQRISGSHVVYACSGMEDDGCFKTGRTYADEHYKKSRITVVDDSDPDVIELLDENVEMALTLENLRVELEAAKQRIAELEGNCAALAAENAGIKSAIPESRDIEDDNDNMDDVSLAEDFGFNHAIELMRRRIPETPATDAFLAEVRAEARNEGINYTASRLAAAFNHGFINKSLREVFDVTRMILSAKEELANEQHPLDGLSGEYAEKSLEEWAEQIRKGSSQ